MAAKSNRVRELALSAVISTAIAALVLWPALLDFWQSALPWRDWAKDHVFAYPAIAALINLVILATLLRYWQDRAVKRRFVAVETIAMRSLSQAINDVGRRVVGPIVGADLFAAGIPGSGSGRDDDAAEWSRGAEPFVPRTGFWTEVTGEEICARLVALRDWPEFPKQMFRRVAVARRELQSALAQWASVVVLVPGSHRRLAEAWDLYDSVVELQEEWRGLATGELENWDRLAGRLVRFNAQYLLVLHSLQPSAALPTQGPRGEDGTEHQAFTPEIVNRLKLESGNERRPRHRLRRAFRILDIRGRLQP